MDEPIQVTRLPSGLTVVTERMDRVETVSIGAYVAAGSRNETTEENGVSHFLEHMAFKGTASRSAAAIAEEIEAVGGHINAYTAREQTAYYVKLLKEDTVLGFDIIGDILTHSTFEPEELERERSVILQEIGQANDTPDDIIFDYFQATAFPDQSLGRAVLGSADAIRGMGRSVLTGYMGRNYIPKNIVVAATGKLDHEAVLDLVGKHFGDLPAGIASRFDDATYKGGEFREERDLDQVHVLLGFPSVGYSDPDYYATVLMSTLLGGGMSSRLFQEIREKRGLVYSIYSFVSPFKDGGLFGIYAGIGESEAAELMPVVLAELGKVQDHVNEPEISRARAQVKANLLMSQESTGSRCEQLARQIQTFDRVISTEEVLAKINAVTEADIRRVAGRHFRAAPTLTTVGPSEQVPGLANIVETLAA